MARGSASIQQHQNKSSRRAPSPRLKSIESVQVRRRRGVKPIESVQKCRPPSCKRCTTALTALTQLERGKAVSQTKVRAVAKACFAARDEYKLAVHQVEQFVKTAPAHCRLAGVYVIDAVCRRSKDQSQHDVFTPRFATQILATISALDDADLEDRQRLVKLVENWVKMRLFEGVDFESVAVIQRTRGDGADVYGQPPRKRSRSPDRRQGYAPAPPQQGYTPAPPGSYPPQQQSWGGPPPQQWGGPAQTPTGLGRAAAAAAGRLHAGAAAGLAAERRLRRAARRAHGAAAAAADAVRPRRRRLRPAARRQPATIAPRSARAGVGQRGSPIRPTPRSAAGPRRRPPSSAASRRIMVVRSIGARRRGPGARKTDPAEASASRR